MGKYSSYQRVEPRGTGEPHPVWRGIGCLIILIVPVISFALSMVTVDYAVNQGIQIPVELTGYLVMPAFILNIPGLGKLASIIQGQYYLYAYILLTIFYIVVVSGLIALIYAFMHRATGNSRFSKLDAPPPTTRTKRYKR
jgi:hypothetical protein